MLLQPLLPKPRLMLLPREPSFLTISTVISFLSMVLDTDSMHSMEDSVLLDVSFLVQDMDSD